MTLAPPTFDPFGRRHLTVDGITSGMDWEACNDAPMFTIHPDHHDSCSCEPEGAGVWLCGAVIRTSRPYTPAEERRWLDGDIDEDLDWWTAGE